MDTRNARTGSGKRDDTLIDLEQAARKRLIALTDEAYHCEELYTIAINPIIREKLRADADALNAKIKRLRRQVLAFKRGQCIYRDIFSVPPFTTPKI